MLKLSLLSWDYYLWVVSWPRLSSNPTPIELVTVFACLFHMLLSRASLTQRSVCEHEHWLWIPNYSWVHVSMNASVHCVRVLVCAGGGERGGRGVQAGHVPVGEARVAHDRRAPRLLPAARDRGARQAALPAALRHRHQGVPLLRPHAVPGAAGAAPARGTPHIHTHTHTHTRTHTHTPHSLTHSLTLSHSIFWLMAKWVSPMNTHSISVLWSLWLLISDQAIMLHRRLRSRALRAASPTRAWVQCTTRPAQIDPPATDQSARSLTFRPSQATFRATLTLIAHLCTSVSYFESLPNVL